MLKRALLTFIAVLFIVIGIGPVLSMLGKSVIVDGNFNLQAYAGVMTSAHQWRLMGHSMALSSLVTILTVSVGVPLGILLGKTNLAFRNFFTAIFIIPLLIPPYIIAVSWFDVFSKDSFFAHLFGASASTAITDLLFALPGCTAILFSIFLPIPMLLTMIFLRTINPQLEEVARLVSSWRVVMRGITIPLIMPGILLSAMLVFILSFGEFSVPNFLRYDVFPVESFTQFSAFYNFRAATAAAVPLGVVTLILLFAETAFLRERTYQLRQSPQLDRLPQIELGTYHKWLLALTATMAFVIVIVPIVVLAIKSASISNYIDAFDKAGGSLLRSLVYAVIGASLLSVLGFFMGYLIQTKALKWWRSIDSMTIFLFALPSTVIGIGLISLWNTRWTNFIYAAPTIIILGYLAKYTALTSRISVTELAQIPPSMEEAAQMAGAGWLRRMIFIVAPMARRGLLAGWLVGYIFSLRDTGITMLVYPAGNETLPVRIFTLMANGSAQLIAALCMIMIITTLLPVASLWLLPRIMTRKINR